jgi:antitoxin ParD1/3/4
MVDGRYRRQRERKDRRKSLDEALARGLADAEAGRVTPLDEAFRRLRAELDSPPAGSLK